MKVFQIVDCFCHWDATPEYPTLADTKGVFAPDILFVEAPDYVHEGWGFDETAIGDARFIQPTPPEGWLYNLETGTFYRDPSYPVDPIVEESKQKKREARIAALQAELAALTAQKEE